MTATDQQIRTFLARIGDAAPPAPEFEQLLRRPSNPAPTPRGRSPRLIPAVAVGLLLAVGIAGVASVVRDPDPGTAPMGSALPADPPGLLFVLPADLDTFRVSDGTVSVPDPDGDWPTGNYRWAAIGTPVDGGYEDLVGALSMGTNGRVEELLSLGEWDEVDTSTGPAYISRASLDVDSVVQQRGTHWLLLTASDAEQTDLVQVLSDIQISESGTISLSSSGRVVFTRGVETVRADNQSSTGFTVTVPDGSFWVETFTLSSPLLAPRLVGERIEHIVIGGRNGWLISRRTEQGLTPHALAWSATPRRVVSVTTNSDRPIDTADLVDLAQQLNIVDEPTWRAALPNATTETLRSS